MINIEVPLEAVLRLSVGLCVSLTRSDFGWKKEVERARHGQEKKRTAWLLIWRRRRNLGWESRWIEWCDESFKQFYVFSHLPFLVNQAAWPKWLMSDVFEKPLLVTCSGRSEVRIGFPSCFIFQDLAVCSFLKVFILYFSCWAGATVETYSCEGGAVLVSLAHYWC